MATGIIAASRERPKRSACEVFHIVLEPLMGARSIGCSHWRAQPNDTSNAGQDRSLTGSRFAFNRFPGRRSAGPKADEMLMAQSNSRSRCLG